MIVLKNNPIEGSTVTLNIQFRDPTGIYYIPISIKYTLLALNSDEESWSVVDGYYKVPLEAASSVALSLPNIETISGTTLKRKVLIEYQAFLNNKYEEFVDEINFDITPKPVISNEPENPPISETYIVVVSSELQTGSVATAPLNPVFKIRTNMPVLIDDANALIYDDDGDENGCEIILDNTYTLLTITPNVELYPATKYHLKLSGLHSKIGEYSLKEPFIMTFVTVSGSSAIQPSKDVEYTLNGEYTLLPDEGYGSLAKAKVIVNIPLQTKTVNVNENGTIIVEPDDLYDGLSAIEVVTNVQPNLQNKTVTENNITVYSDSEFDGLSSVSVAVPIEPTRYETITKPGITSITPESGKVAIAAVDVTVTPDEDKEVEITTNGDTTITASADKILNTVTIHTNVPLHNVQNEKNVNINSVGTISITPDSSYDCMRKVNVTVNIPAVNISLYAYTGSNTGLTFYSTKEITVSGDYNIIPKNDGGSFVDFATYAVTVSDVNINFEYDGAVEVLTRDSSSDVTR